MLNLFRNYNPFAVIVLFLITVFVKLGFLMQPSGIFFASETQVVWAWLSGFINAALGRSPFLITFFAIVNLFGQGIFINSIANRRHLYPKATYLPLLTYILVTSLFADWNYLSASLVGNWFLLAMLSAALKLYSPGDVRKQIFNIGCFISLAALLVFPNIVFLLFLMLALAVLRPFNAAEWTVGLLGALTPFYFLAGILYLADNVHLLKQMIAVGFHLPGTMAQPQIFFTAIVTLLAFFVLGLAYLNGFMGRMLFQNKKWWWVILAALLASLMGGTFTVARGYNQWMAMLIPLSFVIANIWFEERKKWIPTLYFYLFVGAIVLVQWYRPPIKSSRQAKPVAAHARVKAS
ncbi:MAG: DUF6427 family protein [Edaphocola sp.]